VPVVPEPVPVPVAPGAGGPVVEVPPPDGVVLDPLPDPERPAPPDVLEGGAGAGAGVGVGATGAGDVGAAGAAGVVGTYPVRGAPETGERVELGLLVDVAKT
jgi:hypothetical protein